MSEENGNGKEAIKLVHRWEIWLMGAMGMLIVTLVGGYFADQYQKVAYTRERQIYNEERITRLEDNYEHMLKTQEEIKVAQREMNNKLEMILARIK